jgi:hypothetical protein
VGSFMGTSMGRRSHDLTFPTELARQRCQEKYEARHSCLDQDCSLIV